MNDQEQWRVWGAETPYGETLYKRATGELPEMESSKKMAEEVARVFKPGDSVLDVGCGAGHYLRSLRRTLGPDFDYVGVDATQHYVELAEKANGRDARAKFKVGDVFAIPLEDQSFEVVMCNNVFLHLPSIAQPLRELVRVSRRSVFLRTLIGNRSFRIKDVHPQMPEFDESGEPTGFHYYNIYSEAYVASLLPPLKRVKAWTIKPDFDFDRQRILASMSDHKGAHDASGIVGDYQVNGYILQPWSILEITL
jgi:ubiquinone/menaquinone biosynthesis C-methylase UbiE